MCKNGTLYYLLADHLGSNSLILDTSGAVVGETRYTAWGEMRYDSGTFTTDYTYTGQYSNTNDFGWMYYKARWYDAALGRFAQADSIVPGAANPLVWDRYAYGLNNPVKYNDPSGHMYERGGYDLEPGGEYADYVYNVLHNNNERQVNQAKVETTVAVVETVESFLLDPIDWALGISDCVTGSCNGLTIIGILTPFVPSRIGKLADKLEEIIPEELLKKTGETLDTIRGKEAHNNYPYALGDGYDYNRNIPGTKYRPDAIDWINRNVREL